MVKTFVVGLENFNLTKTSLGRLGDRKVLASVNLRTYDVTPAVRRIPPSKRLAYLASRVHRWIQKLYRSHPKLSFRLKGGTQVLKPVRRWSQLPWMLTVEGPAREVLRLAESAGVGSIYLTSVGGRRPRYSPKSPLTWYCVRAFVVIRVEGAKSGMQNTEDRFILVRATSFEDAEKRLRRQWREYAAPYLNPNGQMVSWSLEKVIDVYRTDEVEINPGGTEVYSKLGQRRMRPAYVWRPKS